MHAGASGWQNHPVCRLGPTDKHVPETLARDVVRQHAVPVEINIGAIGACSDEYEFGARFLMPDIGLQHLAHSIASAKSASTMNEGLEENVEGHAITVSRCAGERPVGCDQT